MYAGQRLSYVTLAGNISFTPIARFPPSGFYGMLIDVICSFVRQAVGRIIMLENSKCFRRRVTNRKVPCSLFELSPQSTIKFNLASKCFVLQNSLLSEATPINQPRANMDFAPQEASVFDYLNQRFQKQGQRAPGRLQYSPQGSTILITCATYRRRTERKRKNIMGGCSRRRMRGGGKRKGGGEA